MPIAPASGTRKPRGGDIVVCTHCLAPSIVRPRGQRPRLSAPSATMLIDLRRHPEVRALVDAIQRGVLPPGVPAAIRTPLGSPSDARYRRRSDIAPIETIEVEATDARPPVADLPPEPWEARVAVWMELRSGARPDAIATAHGLNRDFVERVHREGLLPSHYRVMHRGDRIMVDDGSGIFVSWKAAPSASADQIRSA